jgi:hypothetical protein
VKAEAAELLESPCLWKRILGAIAEAGVVGEYDLAGCVYAIGTSRLLPKPLAGIIRGPSSSGKSFIVNKVASLFPDECLVRANQMTPQALFHMKPGSLVHKWIVAGERSRREDDEAAEATRALREMLSEGRLVKQMATKAPAGGIETIEIRQDGPIAFTETTTLANVFDEDANRALMMVTDERKEQTANIISATAQRAAGMGTPDLVRICAVHFAMQRMLPICDVIVPFAVAVGKLFNHRLEARREFPRLLQLTKAIALLHYRQRERDGDRLVATLDDYEIAEELARAPLTAAASGVGEGAKRFLAALKENFPGAALLTSDSGYKPFTSSEARAIGTSSRRTIESWLSELNGAGLLEQVEASKGKIPAKWRITTPTAGAVKEGPPSRKQVEEVLSRE